MKIVVWLLAVPLLLFAGLAALVYHYQDDLEQYVLTSVNEQIAGEMTIGRVSVRPFKNFPYVSIDLGDVRFYETKDTSERPLYTFQDVYLGFDLKSILAGTYDVKKIRVENGHVDLVHRADGTYNLLAAKALRDTTAADSTQEEALHLDLQRLEIVNLDVHFADELADRVVDMQIHRVESRIRYGGGHFFVDLFSDLHLDVVEQGEPTFFSHKAIHLDMELDYDASCNILTVLPSKADLEAAKFGVEGEVDFVNDLYLSLTVAGEKPDFSLIAAFLPEDIASGLKNYQNAGQVFFLGKVEGRSLNGHIPAVNVEFGCENAYFLNTNVNKRVDDLRFTGSFTNGTEGTLRSSILQLRNFYARPEEGVFEGNLFIRNFIDPFVKVDIHADLDLEFLGKFFQLEQLENASGKILLDMDFDELVDISFPGESLARLKTGIDSDLYIKDLNFGLPQYGHVVRNVNGHAVMRKGEITLDSISLQVGESDLWVEGSISDFPALFHRYDKPLRMEMVLKADRIDLPDLLAYDTSLAKQYPEVVENLAVSLAFDTRAEALFNFAYLPRGEFYIEDLYAQLKHYPHVLHDFHADVIITEQDLQLVDFKGEVDKTDFFFTGKLENYPKWMQEKPKGDSELEFDFTSKHFSLEDIFTYQGINYVPEEYRTEVFEDAKLHGRVAMHYDQGFKSVDLYLEELTAQTIRHPLKLQQFKGRAHLENDHLLLESFTGVLGRSDFDLDMSYFLGEDASLQTRDNYLNIRSKRLDIDQLVEYPAPEEKVDHAEAYNIFSLTFPNLALVADIGHFKYQRYQLYDLHTRLRIQKDHYLYVDTLRMGVADGRLAMSGYFNGSDPEKIYFHSNLNADRLDLDALLIKMDNFGQDVLVNENLHGRLSGNIRSTFRMHPDFTPITSESEAHMELTITDGSLENFAPILAFSDYFKDKNMRMIRFDTLENVFDLKEGVLYIPSMLINSSVGFLELSGQQSLDLSMAYFVRIPLKLVTQVAWRKLFGGKSQEEVNSEQIDEIEEVGDVDKVRFVNIRITGTPDDYSIQLGRDKSQKKADRQARRAARKAGNE